MQASKLLIVGLAFALSVCLRHVLAAAILALSMVTSVLAGPFDEAIAAYNRQDYASALQLLRPLAENGNVRAQFLLGFMYEGGMGVSADEVEAAKWYRRAADKGDDIAQYHMGIMHMNGQGGLPRDLVAAYMWLDLAAMRGHLGAATDRDRLARSMNAAQIAEAQKLTREWRSKPEP
jgi:TPR repeat protein